tara:strand:+ start:330 stop:1013 length:684 start_codon:yes stop_codon:yes gene_type:complete
MEDIVYLNKMYNVENINTKHQEHIIQKGDILDIKIISNNKNYFEIFNISNSPDNPNTTDANLFVNGFVVNQKNEIEIPTIGKINLYGLSIEETKLKIEKSVKEFILEATVIVKLINFNITVLGEVKKPGNYIIYDNEVSLLKIIGLAGDLTDFGNRKKIKIIRDSKINTLDITNSAFLYNEFYYLKSGDIIYVEPRNAVRLRSSSAQTFISAASTVALIANIILRQQ